ncbi:MAG: discoidin domain-containing protein [Bacteroidales bacterium]|nr:discoidin domain-containing protein [Bacteroidales bacterium]
MKKLFFSALALTAVLASCTKESEIKTEQLGSTPIEIKVTLDEETKTAYAGEKTFSWVAGDVIAFEVEKDGKYDVISLTTAESGTTVTFKGDLPDGYTATGRAFYPKPGSKTDYYSSGLGIQEDGTIRMWGTITPDLDNPMASIPLVGKQQTSGDFKFITACGIIKVTVENIPSDAYFFQLDAPSGTALNGNFTVGDDQTIKMANVSGTPWPQKYVSFTPQADKETRTFYIPIPVGTVPAGTKAQMRISGGKEVLIAETKSDITIVRNKIIDIGTISYPSETWTSLGVGKFRDNFVFPFVDLSGYVEREFFQSSLDANVFRITQPYPGTNSGEWFVFDVTDPTKVKSDNYFVDIEVTDAVAGKATFKPWIRNGVDYGYKFSKVLKTQTGGLPACIEIGPCYRGEEFSTAANPYDYEIGRDNDPANYGYERGTIEIVFPGCEPYAPDLAPGQIALTSSNVTASDICTHDGQGLTGLLDDDVNTYWHSNWYYAATNDATYGIYFDIKLTTAIQKFHFVFITRSSNSNASPTHIVYGGSNDGTTWTKIGEEDTNVTTSTGGGVTITLNTQDAGVAYQYLRFGITDSTDSTTGSLTGDLSFTGTKKSVNMAELKLFND